MCAIVYGSMHTDLVYCVGTYMYSTHSQTWTAKNSRTFSILTQSPHPPLGVRFPPPLFCLTPSPVHISVGDASSSSSSLPVFVHEGGELDVYRYRLVPHVRNHGINSMCAEHHISLEKRRERKTPHNVIPIPIHVHVENSP